MVNQSQKSHGQKDMEMNTSMDQPHGQPSPSSSAVFV